MYLYFYPRSPCGERLEAVKQYIENQNFYPRSPCGERLRQFRWVFLVGNFYPRSPCGERLWPGLLARPFFIISIHALLAESDLVLAYMICPPRDFYPRSPCGERLLGRGEAVRRM